MILGEPFELRELRVADVLGGLGSYTVCANEPPWSHVAERVPAPERMVEAWDMDVGHLESLVANEPESATVVGLGGGSAMDTAKFIAWKTGKRLVQIPSITSVDAAFTDAIGVRVGRKVKYVGAVVPAFVVLDVDLVRSAPQRLNRSGVGDILSCHTALWDWLFAASRGGGVAGRGVAWNDEAAALGRTLLAELDSAAHDIRHMTPAAVRWLASAHRRVGAACAHLRHSRFEEGSEHFLAYAYEHRTGVHALHGELVALCVVAMSTLQGNAPAVVHELIARSGLAAHPDDVGVDHDEFVAVAMSLAGYAADERLDCSVIDREHIDLAVAERLWAAVASVPRVSRDRM